jgi:hypothetical protein
MVIEIVPPLIQKQEPDVGFSGWNDATEEPANSVLEVVVVQVKTSPSRTLHLDILDG